MCPGKLRAGGHHPILAWIISDLAQTGGICRFTLMSSQPRGKVHMATDIAH